MDNNEEYYREPHRGTEASAHDGGRRRRLGMFAAIGLLVLFGLVVWFAYSRGVQRGEALAPPLIRAEQTPTKVPPENPGGLEVPNQDKAIYDRLANQAQQQSPERLLPPPEQPRPEPPLPQAAVTPPAATAPAEPARPESRALPPAPATATPAPRATVTVEGPAAPQPADSGGQAMGTAAPANPSAAAAPPPPEPTKTAPPEPKAPPPAAASAPPAPPAPPAERKTAAATPRPAAVNPGGTSARIQLGAFRDVARAQEGWRQLTRQHAELLNGLTPSIVRADLGDKGVFQRLQAGPFPDRSAAQTVCDRLKARGQGCLVVAP